MKAVVIISVIAQWRNGFNWNLVLFTANETNYLNCWEAKLIMMGDQVRPSLKGCDWESIQ